MSGDLGTCTMCEQAPATRVYFAPVCDACHDGLEATNESLVQAEANNPELAELGRKVDESLRRVLLSYARLQGTDAVPTPDRT